MQEFRKFLTPCQGMIEQARCAEKLCARTCTGGDRRMDLQLKGRDAFITGPAKGMGAAITRSFAAEGCRLVLVGRDLAAIKPIAAETRPPAPRILSAAI